MVRSRWIKAVMASVVSTGLAWGQSAGPSSSPAPDDPTGRIIDPKYRNPYTQQWNGGYTWAVTGNSAAFWSDSVLG